MLHVDGYRHKEDKMNEIDVALICKALGDANRLKIVRLLTLGEKCACQLLDELDIKHSTLSHHMKVLSESKLVSTNKEGKWSYYSLNCETLTAYREFIGGLVCYKEPTEGGCRCK